MSSSPHVEAVHWNPRLPIFPGRAGRAMPFRRRANNFGDLIGPLVIDRLRPPGGVSRRDGLRLLSVGSILHLARDGDTVWGTGRNGKIPDSRHHFRTLDVRAVRGPLTRRFLLDRGLMVPELYGDPALLLPMLFPEFGSADERRGALAIMNLNDVRFGRGAEVFSSIPDGVRVVSPRSNLEECIRAIVSSEFVVGSSLHAIVIADAFGVPARLVRSEAEPSFKYEDYFLGTGRTPTSSRSVAEAMGAGPHAPLNFDPTPLIAAFPVDLWTQP
jgi:pyruvyltransferase